MSGHRSWAERLLGPHHSSRQPAEWVSPPDQTEYTLDMLGAGVNLAGHDGHDDPLIAGLAGYAADVRMRTRMLAPAPRDSAPAISGFSAPDLIDVQRPADIAPIVITLTERTPHRGHGRGQRRSLAVAASVAAIVLAMSGTALAVADHHQTPGLSTGPSAPTAASAATAEVNDLLAHASYLLTAATHAQPSQQPALRGLANADLAHARSLLPEVTQGQAGFTATLIKLQGQVGLPAVTPDSPGASATTPGSAHRHPGARNTRSITSPTTRPFQGAFPFAMGHGHLPSGHASGQSGKVWWSGAPQPMETGATAYPSTSP